MDFLQSMHSGLRWILLLAIIYTLVNAFKKWKGNNKFGAQDKMLAVITLALMHTQVVIGFILYFGNEWYRGFSHMEIGAIRFFALEHWVGMIIAAVLITIGYKRVKNTERAAAKHRKVWLWYGIATLIILLSIPWPFLSKFSHVGWF